MIVFPYDWRSRIEVIHNPVSSTDGALRQPQRVDQGVKRRERTLHEYEHLILLKESITRSTLKWIFLQPRSLGNNTGSGVSNLVTLTLDVHFNVYDAIYEAAKSCPDDALPNLVAFAWISNRQPFNKSSEESTAPATAVQAPPRVSSASETISGSAAAPPVAPPRTTSAAKPSPLQPASTSSTPSPSENPLDPFNPTKIVAQVVRLAPGLNHLVINHLHPTLPEDVYADDFVREIRNLKAGSQLTTLYLRSRYYKGKRLSYIEPHFGNQIFEWFPKMGSIRLDILKTDLEKWFSALAQCSVSYASLSWTEGNPETYELTSAEIESYKAKAESTLLNPESKSHATLGAIRLESYYYSDYVEEGDTLKEVPFAYWESVKCLTVEEKDGQKVMALEKGQESSNSLYQDSGLSFFQRASDMPQDVWYSSKLPWGETSDEDTDDEENEDE
ncbi:hypothetical protein HDV05_008364 [Chytridiales sp. JEL 0842]|nr:hypothetical protein HDV05_008364 [Chytridiales sp. JEL 0842]